jgi:hypothetical protein
MWGIFRVRTFNIPKGVPFSVAQIVLLSRRGKISDLGERRMAMRRSLGTTRTGRGTDGAACPVGPSRHHRSPQEERTHRAPGAPARALAPDPTRHDLTLIPVRKRTPPAPATSPGAGLAAHRSARCAGRGAARSPDECACPEARSSGGPEARPSGYQEPCRDAR